MQQSDGQVDRLRSATRLHLDCSSGTARLPIDPFPYTNDDLNQPLPSSLACLCTRLQPAYERFWTNRSKHPAAVPSVH